VVGCVFGGEWEDPDLRDSKELDGYSLEHFGQKVVKTDLAVTEKYHYHKEFQTGGREEVFRWIWWTGSCGLTSS